MAFPGGRRARCPGSGSSAQCCGQRWSCGWGAQLCVGLSGQGCGTGTGAGTALGSLTVKSPRRGTNSNRRIKNQALMVLEAKDQVSRARQPKGPVGGLCSHSGSNTNFPLILGGALLLPGCQLLQPHLCQHSWPLLGSFLGRTGKI